MKSFLTTSFCFGFLLALASCASSDTIRSDQVDQNVLYQSLESTFDAQEGIRSARAWIRVGGSTGTTVELVSPSAITHSLLTISKTSSSLLGTYYSGTSTDTFEATQTFIYTDQRGTAYTNSFEIQTIDFASVPTNISKDVDLSMTWADGEAREEEESITLTIRDENGRSIIRSALMNATSISVPKEDLNLLQTGLVRLQLERQKTSDLTEKTERGGHATAIYRSSYSSANLVE